MTRRLIAGVGPIALGLLVLVGPGRAEAQIGIAPGVATIPDGVAMTAVPVVSADRRYVRVSVDASFQTVDGFTTVPIPFAVSGLGSGTGLGGLRGLGGAGGGNLGGLGGGAGGANGAGGVAGVAMGMNGPTSGPSPAGVALAGLGQSGTFPGSYPISDTSAGSFDNSFRMAPVPSPTRKAPKPTRSQRSARSRGKPAGS